MFKLRQTWPPFFTNLCLYNVDTRSHDIDPAWPITARVPDPPPYSTFLQRVKICQRIDFKKTIDCSF